MNHKKELLRSLWVVYKLLNPTKQAPTSRPQTFPSKVAWFMGFRRIMRHVKGPSACIKGPSACDV